MTGLTLRNIPSQGDVKHGSNNHVTMLPQLLKAIVVHWLAAHIMRQQQPIMKRGGVGGANGRGRQQVHVLQYVDYAFTITWNSSQKCLHSRS